MSRIGTLTTDFFWDQYTNPWDQSASPLTIHASPRTQSQEIPLEVFTTLVGTENRETDFRDGIAAIRSYRKLPVNWDTYGGVAAADGPIEFAINLMNDVRITPGVSAPLVQPISGGVYLEWRCGDRLLYFEVDEESVLRYSRNAFGEETAEDATFDTAKASKIVVEFHENAA